MRVMTSVNYLGRDEKGVPIIDWDNDNTGSFVLGVYANIQSVGICVVRIYHDNSRWDVVDEYVTYQPDIADCLSHSKKFMSEYKIYNVFGNTTGVNVCRVENVYSSSDLTGFSGYQITEIEPEHMMFLVQGHLKNIKFKEHLRDKWHEELQKFDVEKLRNSTITSPRVFSLACVIKNAVPYSPVCLIGEIPNIVINNKGEVIKDNRSRAGYMKAPHNWY